MKILEEKVNVIVDALVKDGWIPASAKDPVSLLVQEKLEMGGSHQLLEMGDIIQTKIIVRDSSGDISGMQG